MVAIKIRSGDTGLPRQSAFHAIRFSRTSGIKGDANA